MQTQKWVNLGLLITGTMLFLFFNQLFSAGWGMTGFSIGEEWPVEPVKLISVGIAVALAIWLRKYEKANSFFNEVAMELAKVTWPQRKETVASAGVVVILLGIASLTLFVIDTFWEITVRWLLSL